MAADESSESGSPVTESCSAEKTQPKRADGRPGRDVALVLACVVLAAVLLRMLVAGWGGRGAALSPAEFWVSVTLLAGALLALLLGSPKGRSRWAGLEAFQDALETVAARGPGQDGQGALGALRAVQDTVLASLDRVVRAVHQGTRADEPDVLNVDIDSARYPGLSAQHLNTLRLQYKKTAFWFCQLRNGAPETYAALMRALGAAPPVFAPPEDPGAPDSGASGEPAAE